MTASMPILAGDNYVRDATLDASTESTTWPGGYVENLADDRPSTRWTGTGSSAQWTEADLGSGALTEDWADLASWTETDANGTLAVAAGDLVYDSGANADDSPDVDCDLSLAVDDVVAFEIPFDVTAFATATDQAAYLTIECEAGYLLRLKIDSDGGTPRVTFQRDANAGSYTDVGTYTLSGGTSGRLNVSRAADGVWSAQAYDDNDSAYHALGSYDGDANFESATLAALAISFMVDTRTAGSLQATLGDLYHSDDTGVTFWGVSGHDLYTQGASVSLEASVGGVGWTTVQAAVTPADNKTFGRIVTSGAYRYYRQNIPSGYTAPPSIGVWYLGPYLQFLAYVSGNFDRDHRALVLEPNRQADGQFLGSALKYQDRKVTLNFSRLTLTWAAANVPELFDLVVEHPVFIAWEITGYPNDVWYLELDQNELTSPLGPNSQSLKLDFRGPYET